MFRRLIIHRRARNVLDKSNVPAGTAAVASSSISTNKWALALSVPVVVGGIPTTFKVNGVAPTAVTVTDAQHILLTFAANVVAGQTWVIAANEPMIRTANGGYVAAATGTF